MPKAAIDDDNFSQSRKHQIRRARQPAVVQTKSKAEAVRDFPDNQLGTRVPRSHSRHRARTFGSGKDIGHRLLPIWEQTADILEFKDCLAIP
jgi:hypothetical protein